ncbi:PmoA family protein [bacterium]|nr:PmoA family protein [bacterium]
MKKIKIKNKVRDFKNSPIKIEWEEEGIFLLNDGKNSFYGQTNKVDGKIYLLFIPPSISSDTEVEYTVNKTSEAPQSVALKQNDNGTIDVFINETLFTTYNYATQDLVRPFLFPVIGPKNKSVLRTPPAPGNPEKVDHRHHRGIWVSHGIVNGVDNWSEEGKHGYTFHKDFSELTSGPVFAKIHSVNHWVKFVERGDVKREVKILEEERIITVYNLPEDFRIIDHKIILNATEGETIFKDTKESGLLSVRLNPSMEERKGGRMVNAHGGIGEDECWGKRADWCDYCGEVEGVKCGVSVFDQPSNFRYPTYWHIRSYGLFTANFLGISDFTKDKTNSGTHILPAYEKLPLEYRICIHKGYTEESGVSDRYLNFINPPTVTIE